MGVEFSTEPDSPLKGWFDEVEESARAERRARDERIIRATIDSEGNRPHPASECFIDYDAIIAAAEEETT